MEVFFSWWFRENQIIVTRADKNIRLYQLPVVIVRGGPPEGFMRTVPWGEAAFKIAAICSASIVSWAAFKFSPKMNCMQLCLHVLHLRTDVLS